jgi:S1-C subfamily serine protease
VRVALAAACPLGTRRMLHWAGVLLQAAYRGVRDLGFAPGCATEEDAAQAAAAGSPAAVSHGNAPPSGVFLARYSSGSPAHHWGLTKLSWITDVNGVPTPDLDAFVAVVAPLRDGADVRLAIVTLDTKRSVRTLRLDLHYWPTYELVADADGEWHRRDI